MVYYGIILCIYIYICISPSLAEIMITVQLFQLLHFTCSVCQSSTWIGTAGCEPMGCRYGSKNSTDIAMSNWLRPTGITQIGYPIIFNIIYTVTMHIQMAHLVRLILI